jgi:hypothetical protein
MLIEDPVTCFIMDFCGWQLSYKTYGDLAEILDRSGLIWTGGFHDPRYQFHCVVIGEKPFS